MPEFCRDMTMWRAKWRVIFLLAIYYFYISPLTTAERVVSRSILLPMFVLVLSTVAGWLVVGFIVRTFPENRRCSIRVAAIYLALPAALAAAGLWAGLQMVGESTGAYIVFGFLGMVRPQEPCRLPDSRREWAWLVAAIIGLVIFGVLDWRLFHVWLPRL